MIRVLGIESSCDDTGAAIVVGAPQDEGSTQILSNIIITQKTEHAIYQGVVPEIASRSHMKNLKTAVEMALSEAKMQMSDIDVIAATCGPGLIGGVMVGTMFGKALASVLKKPFIAVNHLEGHVLTARLTHRVEYPYLLLLASGGHCQYVAALGLGEYKILGQTMDDALGEAFDKVAKMMGLGFPGGPEIEERAKLGDDSRFAFPQPMINSQNCDMSFSGLKTAVKLKVDELYRHGEEALGRRGHPAFLSSQDVADVAASFQKTVGKIIYKKTGFAINEYEKLINVISHSEDVIPRLDRGIKKTKLDCPGPAPGNDSPKTIVVAGGVAANESLRAILQKVALERAYNFVAPPIKLCTDNAAMIAFAGLERFNSGIMNDIGFKPRARWSLEEL